MQIFLLSLIALVWFIGTCFRIYRQARFYQIEEYMSLRYLRWLFGEWERWLPLRAVGAFLGGTLLGFVSDSIPSEMALMPYLAALVAGGIAVWPPRETEIKRKFVRTARVSRILGTAFVLAALDSVLTVYSVSLIGIDSDRVAAAVVAGSGLFIFLLAPIWLILGNLLMTPVEAFFRQRFIRKAEAVLAAIQPKIIGITGSYGKTTTKNYLRDILNGRYKTYATPKSYNTLMGICLAINKDLADDFSVEYFISEMGAYVEGEIERICKLTPPDISIVVEVGPQHLERFGSLENVAKAKYEIIHNLKPSGLGVFNWDNPLVREMYERGYPNNRIAVSKTISPDKLPNNPPRFIASEITETLNGLVFLVTDIKTGQNQVMTTALVGEHNITNLLLAIAVAVHEGMSLRDIALRVSALQPAESRLVRQVSDNGITIINDAYSANPVGVVSSLKVLGMHQQGKRLLITPGMVELGELEEQENRKLGEIAADYASDIILVGTKRTEPIKAGILAKNFPAERLMVVDKLSEAVEWYKNHLKAGDTVLFLNDLPDTY
jgi:UDP-N-acetylmuramoyl-tripeptide--D-alanyl-D-alanine ligase